jgi:hypothetical protein
MNSKLFGYYFYNLSVQWGKGEEKRATIRNVDIEKLPFMKIMEMSPLSVTLFHLVNSIKQGKQKKINTLEIENQVDDLIFDLYDLTEYQKEIIREFYQIRVERASKELKYLQVNDIKRYIEEFSTSFNLVLKNGSKLTGSYHISKNVGAVVCFTIVDDNNLHVPKDDKNLEILHFVKRKQISNADRCKILNEDKVKIYDNENFYIIKSNLFKDWTVRQAMKDAKEEIGLLLSKLPKR